MQNFWPGPPAVCNPAQPNGVGPGGRRRTEADIASVAVRLDDPLAGQFDELLLGEFEH